jgi:hypothetical protein
MSLDYLNKRVTILTLLGYLVLMDYDGGNRSEILIDRSIRSGVFSQIGSSMFFRKTNSPVIVEMNVTSRNISRYIWSTGGKYSMKLIVVDRFLQPGGRFYTSNIYFKNVVNHVRVISWGFDGEVVIALIKIIETALIQQIAHAAFDPLGVRQHFPCDSNF